MPAREVSAQITKERIILSAVLSTMPLALFEQQSCMKSKGALWDAALSSRAVSGVGQSYDNDVLGQIQYTLYCQERCPK